jgi:hypothetical protein
VGWWIIGTKHLAQPCRDAIVDSDGHPVSPTPEEEPMPHPNTLTCPQCSRIASVSEPFAFRGMDRLRMTLSCGHVVPRTA